MPFSGTGRTISGLSGETIDKLRIFTSGSKDSILREERKHNVIYISVVMTRKFTNNQHCRKYNDPNHT